MLLSGQEAKLSGPLEQQSWAHLAVFILGRSNYSHILPGQQHVLGLKQE